MADEIDRANDRAAALRAIADVRKAAAGIPQGEPGICDFCGEHSTRLVGGAGAPCRTKHRLP